MKVKNIILSFINIVLCTANTILMTIVKIKNNNIVPTKQNIYV